jgi:hypothetical protein
VPWANGFCPKGRIPLLGDVNADGLADLIAVNAEGEGFIDVAFNRSAQKSGIPVRSRSDFGKDLQAAWYADGSLYAVQKDGTILRAYQFEGTEFKKQEPWLKLPVGVSGATMSSAPGSLLVWTGEDNQAYVIDTASKAIQVEARERPTVLTAGGSAGSIWRTGDMDGDKDADRVEFRFDPDPHRGNNVLIHRLISEGEKDSDADGITNAEEATLGTDPMNPDSDNDGLVDGWEVGTYHDLDMKALGCDPLHADVICLISRFSQVDDAFCRDMLGRAVAYYAKMESPNPDGKKGWNLHLIYRDPLDPEQQKKGWPEQRDTQIPAKWKGVVHWMQISPSGGGQADQLGDGGGCGGGGWALYATYVHEFGHQLGLSHEGFYNAAWCPTYPSLMNYAYSYTLEGDIKNVRYSDGRLADYTMKETDLSEVIPLPLEKVKFLGQPPYNYRMKADGDKTLIDWNWNGVFGEEHIRADINYSYSTTAGRRDEAGKTESSPWLVTNNGSAYVLYALAEEKPERRVDSTVSDVHPGSLYLRKLVKPYEWEKVQKLTDARVTGDPVAISYHGRLLLAYPTKAGVEVLIPGGTPKLIPGSVGTVPSLGLVGGKPLMVLWNSQTKRPSYAWWHGTTFKDFRGLRFTSTSPVGLAEDTLKHQLIIGLSQDQKNKPGRWQLRRFEVDGTALLERSKEWIEGEGGNARGSSRPVVLFDADTSWGPNGRTYYFALGTKSKQAPWSCAYVAHTIGDATVGGGWRVKRYYDEWTQSRSAPAAAWFGDDIIYAYRWVDGGNPDRDNLLHVAYRGSGIEDATMGDFDDIGFIRNFGMRYSILYVAND